MTNSDDIIAISTDSYQNVNEKNFYPDPNLEYYDFEGHDVDTPIP